MAGPTSPATGDPATAFWADSVATDLADSGWITLSLGNSWAAFGGVYMTPAYRKLANVVYVAGLMASGTSGTAFTLPVGSRPLHNLIFSVGAGVGGAILTVTSGGAVTVGPYFGSGSNADVSLNGVTFIAEQ
jgi:hypothetical protein